MGDYIKECLKPILGDDISDDIIEYILTIKHEEDYAEFMENIVDMNNPKHLKVYEMLKREQFGTPSKKNKSSTDYRDSKMPFQTLSTIEDSQKSSKNSGGKGKKQKYVNFYTQDHKPGLRKGRHPCNCQATKHELINNCTKCGRIVCEQEGSGPCFFCDNMVCTRLEMEVLQSNSKESDKLYNHLMEKKKSNEWKKAMETRNRLIKTDQLGDEIKNKVYDDQNDYFDMNSQWMTDDEKRYMKKKQVNNYNKLHKSRRDLKLALDFASRTVTIDNNQPKFKDNLMKGVNKLLDNTDRRFPKNLFDGTKGELIAEIVKLMEEQKLSSTVPEIKENTQNGKKDKKVTSTNKFRIANDDFLESVDQGMCLSMHQPWASLLVAGIKIHEGRTWRTDHRGRLWIAAGSREPEDEEVLTCEQMYRELYDDPQLEFPKKYPTGCLLGCVFVDDCLEQSEYRRKYPNGESSSPYVLICSSPVILPIFYPMQGQHKIFPLSKELHKTAKAALLSSKWI